ncbi:MAG: zinc-ribbon domain-containing protein [bacterium]
MSVCSNCGQKLHPSANYCTKCGKNVQQENESAFHPQRTVLQKIFTLNGIVCAFFLFFAIAGVFRREYLQSGIF